MMMIEQQHSAKNEIPLFRVFIAPNATEITGKRYTLDSSRKDLKWMHLKGSLRITWKTRTLSL